MFVNDMEYTVTFWNETDDHFTFHEAGSVRGLQILEFHQLKIKVLKSLNSGMQRLKALHFDKARSKD